MVSPVTNLYSVPREETLQNIIESWKVLLKAPDFAALEARAPDLVAWLIAKLAARSRNKPLDLEPTFNEGWSQIRFERGGVQEIFEEYRYLRLAVVTTLEQHKPLHPPQRDFIWEVFDREIFNLRVRASTPLGEDPASAFQPLVGTISAKGQTTPTPLMVMPAVIDRSCYLEEASRLLFESIEYEVTVPKIVQIALKTIADWCMVDLIREDQSFERVAATHRNPAKAHLMMELQNNYKPHFGARGVPSQVLRTGEALLIPEVTDAHYAATARNRRHEEILRSIGSSSYMCVPLMARGHFLGAVTFVSSDYARKYNADDLKFAEGLCSRAAQAIDNSLLYKKAQLAVRQREDVINIVSHDLKNPIAALTMSIALLSKQASSAELKTDRLHRIAETMRRSVNRMDSLVSDLLDLSKIQAGQFRVECQLEPVNVLVNEIIDIFAPMALNSGINLESNILGHFDVFCDRDRMIQVLSNLCSNAIKFTPRDGRILIESSQSETETIISVSDTGPGIPEEHLPHLFERFWQAQTTSKLGTGLGLSIVKAMVEAHGGRVSVKSQLGVGTTFFLVLPNPNQESGAFA